MRQEQTPQWSCIMNSAIARGRISVLTTTVVPME